METVIGRASVVAVKRANDEFLKKSNLHNQGQGQMLQNLTLVTSCEYFYVLIEYSYTLVAKDYPFFHCKDTKVSSFHRNLRATIFIFDNIAMKKC